MEEKKNLPKNWFDNHTDVYVCPKCGGADGESFQEKVYKGQMRTFIGRKPTIFFTKSQLHEMLERVFIKGEGYRGAARALGTSAQVVHTMLNRRYDYREIVTAWKLAHGITGPAKRRSWLKGRHHTEDVKRKLSKSKLGGKELGLYQIDAMQQARLEGETYRSIGERFGCSDTYVSTLLKKTFG